jgi:DNA-directed RNA polymerase subunit K/omega
MDDEDTKGELENEIEDDNESDIDNDDLDDNNSIVEDDNIDDDDDDDDEEEKNDDDLHDEEENEKKFKDSEDIPLMYDKKILINDYDLENNDSLEFLQKFNEDNKEDYIVNNHFELLNKNLDEIKKLSQITKDNNNNIIDEFHRTLPILTKYEKTKILGIRLKQLNNGSEPFINVNEDIIDNNIIALKELENKKLPFIIVRPLPNRTFEYWKLKDLEVY